MAVERARELRRSGALRPQPLYVSRLAEERVVAGVPVRVFTPPEVGGTYLHLHGGGFVYGSARLQDERLERLALACRVEVFSVEYRLAPEDPYPAAPDDCEAVALWLAERDGPLAIGGGSAGANLAVTTLVRLRDRHGFTGFRGAVLSCGVYDLALPHFAGTGDPSLTREELTGLIAEYAGEAPITSPDLSPAHADLSDLPDALIAVGSLDPLVQDSVLMAERWRNAGSMAQLVVIPDGLHGVDAADDVDAFLRSRLGTA